jgi:hypothetical protein
MLVLALVLVLHLLLLLLPLAQLARVLGILSRLLEALALGQPLLKTTLRWLRPKTKPLPSIPVVTPAIWVVLKAPLALLPLFRLLESLWQSTLVR